MYAGYREINKCRGFFCSKMYHPNVCMGDRQKNMFSFQQNAGPFTCDLFAIFYNHKVKNSIQTLDNCG